MKSYPIDPDFLYEHMSAALTKTDAAERGETVTERAAQTARSYRDGNCRTERDRRTLYRYPLQ